MVASDKILRTRSYQHLINISANLNDKGGVRLSEQVGKQSLIHYTGVTGCSGEPGGAAGGGHNKSFRVS